MQTTTQLADILGRKNMAAALGVGKTAISKEVLSGTFPPGWYVAIRALCEGAGVECPEHLFNWKSPSVHQIPKVSVCDSQDTLDRGVAQETVGCKE